MGIGTTSMQKHNTIATPTLSFINESVHVIHRHLGTWLSAAERCSRTGDTIRWGDPIRVHLG